MLEKVAEESAHEPIAALIFELTYANVCPLCREKQVLAGPLTEAERLLPRQHVSPWDLPDETAADEEAQRPVATKKTKPPIELPPGESLAGRRELKRQRQPIVKGLS
jgi:hypothetical protein